MKRLALLALLLVGCDVQAPPAASSTPAPTPGLPPLPEISIAQLDWTTREPAAELPAGGEVALAWDLSARKYRAYTYLQRTQLTSVTEAKGQVFRMPTQAKHEGYVEIEGGGNGLGELRFKRTLKAQSVDGAEVAADKINEDKPAMFQCRVAGDGTFLESRRLQGQSEAHYLDLLLALPPGPLAPGGTARREFHFATNTTDFGHHGASVLRHAGRAKVLGRDCVKLVSDFELELVPPRPLEAVGRIKGRVVAYVDPALGCFVSVDAAFSLVVHSRGLVSPPEGKGEPFPTQGRTASDTQISIRLKD